MIELVIGSTVCVVALVVLAIAWCVCTVSGRCARLDKPPGVLPDLDHRDHIGEARP